MKPYNRTCDRCACWKEEIRLSLRQEGNRYGCCRLNPPVLVDYKFIYPRTHPSDGCHTGFVPKEEE